MGGWVGGWWIESKEAEEKAVGGWVGGRAGGWVGGWVILSRPYPFLLLLLSIIQPPTHSCAFPAPLRLTYMSPASLSSDLSLSGSVKSAMP